MGAQHCPLGLHALWGAARHGGGGGRLGSGAPSSLLPAPWAGCRGPLATCCRRGCECVLCVWCLCSACRGAWCRLSPVPLVLRSLVLPCGVVPAVCRVPAVLPSLCGSLARLLATPGFLRGFTALYSFLCSPFSLACTFFLPPPWSVSLSFSSPARLSLFLGPVRQGKDGGMWAFGGPVRSSCNVGTTCVAAVCSVAWCVTYLSAHLCLRVCARSSTFAPYHGVLMSLSLYLFVCCSSWRRCTPYAKGACEGGGPPSYSSPCSLVARLLARAGRARCVTYLRLHLVRARTCFFCSFRSLLLLCARRGITW